MIARNTIKPLRLFMLAALLLAFAFTAVAPTSADETHAGAIDTAVEWLRNQQLDDGAFSAFGGESDPGATADVVFALAAAGIDPATVTSAAGSSPLDYLSASAESLAETPGLAGKVALAFIASGADPRAVSEANLIKTVETGFNTSTGMYGEGLSNHTYAVLALAATDSEIEPAAIDALLSTQISDGSWGFTGDTTEGTGDSNTTALVIQALAALKTGDDAISEGIEYLRTLADENGAIAYDASTAPDLIGDANSTAVAIQAFVAAGEDPSGMIEALTTFQNENGAFFWQAEFPDDSLLATAQAVPALALVPLPVFPAETNAQDTSGVDAALSAARQPAEQAADCVYFEITQHNACGLFAEFWTANGGLMIFGYPMTEEFVDESGMTVQYFERARFEWHPDLSGTPYEVLLGRLGAEHIDHADQP